MTNTEQQAEQFVKVVIRNKNKKGRHVPEHPFLVLASFYCEISVRNSGEYNNNMHFINLYSLNSLYCDVVDYCFLAYTIHITF